MVGINARLSRERDRQPALGDAAPRRSRGRPRQPATDTAIVQATIDLLTEVGIDGTTTNAIVERSGCSKATIYRRWPTRDALILDALRTAMQGRPADIDSVVNLERELGSTVHAAGRRGAAVFDSQIVRAVYPTIIKELLAGSEIGEQFRTNVFVPIRTAAKARLLEAMERGEIDPTVDRDLVFDLIYGGLMYRVFVGETVDENTVQALADLVMNGAAGPRYRNRSTRAKPRVGAEATARG
jgi:AcrR family transcriptional regulator